MIRLVDLYKSFNSLDVLKGLSLDINRGETMVVLGRSGCGKSVLLKVILRLLPLDSGEVWFGELNTSDFTDFQMVPIRRRIGMLFQGSALFDSMTVFDNIAYPLLEHTTLSHDEIVERIRRMLEFVEMEGTEHKMPGELSGGMKKRIALARALVANPDYVFFDEPTTGIDPITASRINKLIVKTRQEYNVTSIVVTHDIASALFVGDRFSFIYDGKIIFVGDKSEFLACDIPAVKNFREKALWNTG